MKDKYSAQGLNKDGTVTFAKNSSMNQRLWTVASPSYKSVEPTSFKSTSDYVERREQDHRQTQQSRSLSQSDHTDQNHVQFAQTEQRASLKSKKKKKP